MRPALRSRAHGIPSLSANSELTPCTRQNKLSHALIVVINEYRCKLTVPFAPREKVLVDAYCFWPRVINVAFQIYFEMFVESLVNHPVEQRNCFLTRDKSVNVSAAHKRLRLNRSGDTFTFSNATHWLGKRLSTGFTIKSTLYDF